VVVRRRCGEIEVDHRLKLGIANAIHTAMVYLMVRPPNRQQPQITSHTHAILATPSYLKSLKATAWRIDRYRTHVLPRPGQGLDASDGGDVGVGGHQVLSRLPDTAACIGHTRILPYIDRLYRLDILNLTHDPAITRSAGH
jgi:hypothetical protein